ncbi:MAG: hypothetical protein IPL55_13880 [Saprospiraceae bacterium]|nr:hypothetical protein [Saprospiraceae bacterium]
MANESHFETIYNEHKNIVFNMCLNYVLNPDDAQDITQEVFVKYINVIISTMQSPQR